MRTRVSVTTLAGCAFVVLLRVVPAPAVAQVGPCVAHLSGSDHPDIVPAQAAWDELWNLGAHANDDAAATHVAKDLGVQIATVRELHERGSRAVSVIDGIRRSAAETPTLSHGAALAMANASLEERDDLIRALPVRELQQIEKWIRRVTRQMTYTFAPSGALDPALPPQFRCHVKIEGRQHPELIPESFVWSSLFSFVASLPPKVKNGDAEYFPSHVSALQNASFPIPTQDLETLVDLAQRTAAAINSADQNSVNAAGVADLVFSARAELIRRLPKSSWLAVKRQAESIRNATTYNFPTF